MAGNGRVDESVMIPGIPTGVKGVELLVNSFADGTTEVKNLLKYECDVIVECKICRNMFRSLPSFVSHKRIYCKDSAFEQITAVEKSDKDVLARPASTESCPNFTSDDEKADSNGDEKIKCDSQGSAPHNQKRKQLIFKRLSSSNGVNRNETARTASKLSLNFLNRLTKRIETASANPATFVPLHRYPEIHRVVPQVQLLNGTQIIKNPDELDKLPIKDRKSDESFVTMVLPQDAVHRQHAMELRTRKNFTAADTVRHFEPEEMKLYDQLSDSGLFDLSNLTCLVDNCGKSFKTASLAVDHLENGHKSNVHSANDNNEENSPIDIFEEKSFEEREFSLPSEYMINVQCSDNNNNNNTEVENTISQIEADSEDCLPKSTLLNSREKRTRTVKSYEGLGFITSWPKRLKRSPTAELTPEKPAKRYKPSIVAAKASSNNFKVDDDYSDLKANLHSNISVNKHGQLLFPIILTQKQKEQTIRLMNEKDKKCLQCNAVFTSKQNLERHCYIHLGFIRFRCSKCNYGTFYRTELRRHLRSSCPNRKEIMKSNKANDDEYLNSLILPACPEDPGRVLCSDPAQFTNKASGVSFIGVDSSVSSSVVSKKQPFINSNNKNSKSPKYTRAEYLNLLRKKVKPPSPTKLNARKTIDGTVQKSPNKKEQYNSVDCPASHFTKPNSFDKTTEKEKSLTPKKTAFSTVSEKLDDQKLSEIIRDKEKIRHDDKSIRGSFKRASGAGRPRGSSTSSISSRNSLNIGGDKTKSPAGKMDFDCMEKLNRIMAKIDDDNRERAANDSGQEDSDNSDEDSDSSLSDDSDDRIILDSSGEKSRITTNKPVSVKSNEFEVNGKRSVPVKPASPKKNVANSINITRTSFNLVKHKTSPSVSVINVKVGDKIMNVSVSNVGAKLSSSVSMPTTPTTVAVGNMKPAAVSTPKLSAIKSDENPSPVNSKDQSKMSPVKKSESKETKGKVAPAPYLKPAMQVFKSPDGTVMIKGTLHSKCWTYSA